MPEQNKPEEYPDELPRRKWWLKPLIGLILAIGIVIAGRKLYGRLEPERLSRRAHALIEKEDYRGAIITLSRALQINNRSDTATRMMAELMERLQQPEAIDWRRRVTELNPNSSSDAMAWVESALKSDKPDVAQAALDAVPSLARKTGAYQTAVGLTAARQGRWKEARDSFAEALQLNPKDELHRYNLSLAQFQSPDESDRNAAIATLTELSKRGRIQLFAARSLIARLIRDEKFTDATEASSRLVSSPEAQFQDFIVEGELHRHLQRPDWAVALDRAREKAAAHEPDAAAMINWMRFNGQEREALNWASSLPARITDTPLVRVATAQCLAKLKQWDKLGKLTDSAENSWGTQEFRRWEFLARAQFEAGDQTAFAGSWTKALRLCLGDRSRLVQIASDASQWGWTAQAREALWAGADCASPGWALNLLYQGYAREGNTRELLQISRRMVEVNRDDLSARNNVAYFSALLGEDLPASLSVARELVSRSPDSPIFRSTLAFALLANGMPDECIQEIESIPPPQRNEPAYTLMLAIAHQAEGSLEDARSFASRINVESLLPEEKTLTLKLRERL